MQTEHRETETPLEPVTCPNCRTELVAGIRFCRMCGFRLGEGVEEYTATRRFDPQAPPFAPPPPGAQPFAAHTPNMWAHGPMAPIAPMAGLAAPAGARPWRWTKLFMPWRWGWVGWAVLSLAIMVVVGSAISSRNVRGPGAGPPPVQRSYFGVDGFETADEGGAMIEGIAGPDTPAQRAGLIGGDVIKSFDGKEVKDADDLRRLLRRIPAGTAVQVVYVRDGQTQTTTMTTGTERESRGSDVFDQRPGGKGFIGIGTGSLERVPVPGMNIHGVRLGEVHTNRPADIAGLKKGDVVISFNGHPVRTEGDLRYRIYEAVPGETVKAVVVRAGQAVEVMVKMGRSRDDDD